MAKCKCSPKRHQNTERKASDYFATPPPQQSLFIIEMNKTKKPVVNYMEIFKAHKILLYADNTPIVGSILKVPYARLHAVLRLD